MSSGSFQETSLGWQLRLAQRRFGEWIEYQFSRQQPQESWEPPEIDPFLPEWLVRGLVWTLLVAIALWLLWLLARALWPYLQNWRSLPWLQPRLTRSPATSLPTAELMRQIQRYQKAGDYQAACRLFYLAMVQRLHETQQIENRPSRTNGEYLNLFQYLSRETRPYELLTRVHERLYFGGAAISAEVFHQCRRAYQEITKP